MTVQPRALIEGEFGDGAYGPTILLQLTSLEGVELLMATFETLSSGTGEREVRLEECPRVSLSASIMTLRMRVVESRFNRRLVKDGARGFLWSCTPDEWEEAMLLVQPLLTQAGHQYLTSEIEDEALIEVSRGESPPDDRYR